MKGLNQKKTVLTGKQYFTIGEVADAVGISVEVLRKWERDFPNKIKPIRTKGDTRLYRQRDIEQIQMIYRMRHTEGKTIAGVRRSLDNNPGLEESKQEIITHLYNVRQQLQQVVDELDKVLGEGN